MRFRPVLFGVMVTLTSGGFFACGSRTALPGDFDAVVTGNDDSGTDARRKDSGFDANIPPIDARPPVDASRLDCPDADATLIYLITTDNQLLSFYPPAASFTLIGNIACPSSSTPFSMAVDRRGTAYVEFNDGNLFKVSTATAACVATSFATPQQGFVNFGMGFATIGGGPAEQLFIAGDSSGGGNAGLGSIDIPTFTTSFIGQFSPLIDGAELTGTGDGRLFAFWPDSLTDIGNGIPSDTNISEIDKTTGDLIGTDPLPGVQIIGGWAFGYWGGDFYTFTGSSGSTINRYRPTDKTVLQVATYPSEIVGAGVSTCAPQ
ncbi:MAG: hypothetical protein ABI183_12080 [Polyangiaceae bacterium]